MIEFKLNGKTMLCDVSEDTPLLWVLKDYLMISEIKYRCGEGLCGECTIQVEERPIRSCITPVGDVQGKAVTTIEWQ